MNGFITNIEDKDISMRSKIIQSWAWCGIRINLQTSQNMLNILQTS